MFGLHKYLNKIYDIKWYFPSDFLEDVEQLLYVEFEEEEGFYRLSKIHYTYVDILLGLEDMEFELKKQTDSIKLKITKI